KSGKGRYSQQNQNSRHSDAHSVDVLTEGREYWWNEDFLELTARRLDFSTCRNIADIGCGTGSMSFALAPYFSHDSVLHGLDAERTHIRKAAQRARKDESGRTFKFIEGDAHEIPFDDGVMDLSFCQTLQIGR